jgi:hypothetical protein
MRSRPSTIQPSGILRVTRLRGRSRASRWPAPAGPLRPMPDKALVEAIRKLLAASPSHGEGHRKVWARLRFAGIRTSKHRVLRLMLKVRAARAGAATVLRPQPLTFVVDITSGEGQRELAHRVELTSDGHNAHAEAGPRVPRFPAPSVGTFRHLAHSGFRDFEQFRLNPAPS